MSSYAKLSNQASKYEVGIKSLLPDFTFTILAALFFTNCKQLSLIASPICAVAVAHDPMNLLDFLHERYPR